MSAWTSYPLLSFDTETTGLDREQDRIITAGTCLIKPGEPACQRLFTINPGIPIPAEASAIHGIDDQQAAAFTPAAEAIPELIDYLESELSAGGPLVVFNAPYDLTLLDREARRHGAIPLQERVKLVVLDPLVIDRGLDPYRPGTRTLADMAACYKVKLTGAHQASADALASARIAWRLQQRYPELLVSGAALHRQQIIWAESFAAGLQIHYDSQGLDRHVNGKWPLLGEADLVAAL